MFRPVERGACPDAAFILSQTGHGSYGWMLQLFAEMLQFLQMAANLIPVVFVYQFCQTVNFTLFRAGWHLVAGSLLKDFHVRIFIPPIVGNTVGHKKHIRTSVSGIVLGMQRARNPCVSGKWC